MLVAAIVAVAVATGAPAIVVTIVAVAMVQPSAFIVGAVAWAGYRRFQDREGPVWRQEAIFLEGVAAEVRGGSSLRIAIADSAARSHLELERAARLAGLGRPMPAVGVALGEALQVNGPLAGPALTMAADSGAEVGPLFDSLSHRAAAAADEAREQKTATAQARLSAWLVAGVPALAAVAMATVGGHDLFLSGPGIVLAGVGLGLLATGAATVWLMLRNAQP